MFTFRQSKNVVNVKMLRASGNVNDPLHSIFLTLAPPSYLTLIKKLATVFYLEKQTTWWEEWKSRSKPNRSIKDARQKMLEIRLAYS